MFDNFDPTDSRHREISEKISRERDEADITDVKTLLSMNVGRRFFWRYLGKSGVFKSSMTGNNTTFFNEGMRQVGLYLLDDMQKAMPEAFTSMQSEESERQLVEQQKFLKELRNVR